MFKTNKRRRVFRQLTSYVPGVCYALNRQGPKGKRDEGRRLQGSACVPAIVGTHVPRRSEGVEGSCGRYICTFCWDVWSHVVKGNNAKC